MYGMGVDMLHGKGVVSGVMYPQWPIGFSGIFLKRNVFDSCVKS